MHLSLVLVVLCRGGGGGGGGSGTASTAMAVPIFEANNYGCGILWVSYLMSMCSVQCGLITEVAAILLRTERSSWGNIYCRLGDPYEGMVY